MSEAKHTPGPWAFEPDLYELSLREVSGPHGQPYHPFVITAPGGKRGLTVGKVVDDPASEVVARTNGYESCDPPPGFGVKAIGCGGCSEANARLIAAAPEMLRELEETVAWLEERAAVIERLSVKGRYSAMGAGNPAQVEAARLRGRAVLLRQVIAKAKGE